MDELFELNRLQIEAWNEFKKAYRKCIKRKIYFYIVLDDIRPFNGENIEGVYSPLTTPTENEYICISNQNIQYSIRNAKFCSFADDIHFAKLTKKGLIERGKI